MERLFGVFTELALFAAGCLAAFLSYKVFELSESALHETEGLLLLLLAAILIGASVVADAVRASGDRGASAVVRAISSSREDMARQLKRLFETHPGHPNDENLVGAAVPKFRRWRVRGVDSQSGLQTSVVIEAVDPSDAYGSAKRRGVIDVTAVEEVQ